MKQQKNWTGLFLTVFLGCLALVIGLAVYIDPYFHYRAPRLEQFLYKPEVQRSVNDGMVKHLTYDSVIAGSSMTECFKTSQAEEYFGGSCIKVPSKGASWFEVDGLLRVAFRNHPEIKTVIRSLDMSYFEEAPRQVHYEIGPYPTYLYNEKLLDDVYYVLNRDVIYGNCMQMLLGRLRGETPGLGSLDDYSAWGPEIYGKSVAVRRDAPYAETRQQALTEERREKVRCNVREKVVALAQEHPDTTFYCFLTPYSAAWWGDLWEEGQLEAQLEMEEIVIRAILPCKNIRLFSWNTVKELTADLANYKDRIHYGPWVNDWMLEQMASGKGMLTEENVQAYLDEERDLYVNFDYNSLFDQEDPIDYIAPAFFRQ